MLIGEWQAGGPLFGPPGVDDDQSDPAGDVPAAVVSERVPIEDPELKARLLAFVNGAAGG